MTISQAEKTTKILVIAGVWSLIVGVILGIGTWYSLFSRYMYVEDLNNANSWGFDDYMLSAVSGETPFDLFSYFVAVVCSIGGVLLLTIGLFRQRKMKRLS